MKNIFHMRKTLNKITLLDYFKIFSRENELPSLEEYLKLTLPHWLSYEDWLAKKLWRSHKALALFHANGLHQV